MLILAFDSTAKAASVALTDGDRLLADFVCDNGLTHSEILLPMAEDALRRAKKSLSDVDLFAVNVGPGSFTGVRIGVSLVKGLAFGKNIPIAPVSTLLSLAYNLYPTDGILCPVMDARRAQVYNALFRVQDGRLLRLTPDRAIALSDLRAELLRGYADETVHLVGDGYGVAFHALDGVKLHETPALLLRENAYSTARAAVSMYENGETVTDEALLPVYLRMPQAERDRLKKASVTPS